MQLRDYQQDIIDQVADSDYHDLVQLDTGAGKTPIIAELARRHQCVICVAHRNILLGQLSKTLAFFGLFHDLVGTTYTRHRCISAHRRAGLSVHITRGGHRFVASIDSICARYRRGVLAFDRHKPWLIIIDEAHHVVTENKWGKLREIFPKARFVGVTATPCRLDGKSLHITQGGLFDRLVQAKKLRKNSVRKLIDLGYLSDYRYYRPPTEINRAILRLGANSDYTPLSLSAALDKTTIIGDAITHYRRHADGKQAVAMCVSIKNAQELADRFRGNGIPATAISSNLSETEVARRIDAFVSRQVQVLCNVDMVGEGFDVPGIEAIIMLRKTASLVAFRQWVGRALRPSAGKKHAIIIDHVGNIEHGYPDSHIAWDILRAPAGTSRTNIITCPECNFCHYAWLTACPECGAQVELRANGVGGYYVDQNVVDVDLCESIRAKRQQEEIFNNEIVAPPQCFEPGAIGSICAELKAKMVNAMQRRGFPPAEINRFTHTQGRPEISTCSPRFWMLHFTAKDRNAPDEKFIKVFKKWQKLQSSTQTVAK